MAKLNDVDELRYQIAKVQTMAATARNKRAESASLLKTGELSQETGRWQHESLLREMIQFDMISQIAEAMGKSLY